MVRSVVSRVMWVGRARVLTLSAALILAALAASLLVVATRSAEAAFPGTAGDIAFGTNRDGSNQIYRMAADGYDPERLTDTVGSNDHPDWSSDGTMIAFANGGGIREIYVMEHDGDNEVNLTDDPADDSFPAFFPGQQKISFASNRSDAQATTDSDIYALTFDDSMNTTGVTQLTNNINQDTAPAVSPSGKKIVFRSDRDGDAEIFVMKANTPESAANKPVKLTRNTAPDFNPDWSPDGRRIVFVSNRTTANNPTGDAEIFVMNADGTRQKQLTNNTASEFEPAFSSDGKKVAFTSDRDGDEEVWRMRSDGTNPVNLTYVDTAFDFRPSWQPIP